MRKVYIITKQTSTFDMDLKPERTLDIGDKILPSGELTKVVNGVSRKFLYVNYEDGEIALLIPFDFAEFLKYESNFSEFSNGSEYGYWGIKSIVKFVKKNVKSAAKDTQKVVKNIAKETGKVGQKALNFMKTYNPLFVTIRAALKLLLAADFKRMSTNSIGGALSSSEAKAAGITDEQYKGSVDNWNRIWDYLRKHLGAVGQADFKKAIHKGFFKPLKIPIVSPRRSGASIVKEVAQKRGFKVTNNGFDGENVGFSSSIDYDLSNFEPATTAALITSGIGVATILATKLISVILDPKTQPESKSDDDASSKYPTPPNDKKAMDEAAEMYAKDADYAKKAYKQLSQENSIFGGNKKWYWLGGGIATALLTIAVIFSINKNK